MNTLKEAERRKITVTPSFNEISMDQLEIVWGWGRGGAKPPGPTLSTGGFKDDVNGFHPPLIFVWCCTNSLGNIRVQRTVPLVNIFFCYQALRFIILCMLSNRLYTTQAKYKQCFVLPPLQNPLLFSVRCTVAALFILQSGTWAMTEVPSYQLVSLLTSKDSQYTVYFLFGSRMFYTKLVYYVCRFGNGTICGHAQVGKPQENLRQKEWQLFGRHRILLVN